MIIITCEYYYHIYNKMIICNNSNYISSIEYIDNEFDEVLIKEIDQYRKYCVDLERKFHNPIGPAIEYCEKDLYPSKVDYYLKGQVYSKEEFEEAVEKYKNDYCKL